MGHEFVDPYVDPATGVLRNLIGATNYDELRNAEGEFIALRTGEFLEQLPLKPTGSMEDFQKIHQRLFRDIYDWAGRLRTVEIRKSNEGSEFFLPSPNIPMGFQWAQEELCKDHMLKGLSPTRFAQRLAYHFDNYNFIHPFREGNGRTQRLFWTILCHNAGYDLDWCQVTGEENDEAGRAAAEDLELGGLVDMFRRIASPCDPATPLNQDLLKIKGR